MISALPFFTDAPSGVNPEQLAWFREGSCDQCASGPIKGECCTHMALPISQSAARNPDTINFFALHGAQVKWWGELAILIIPQRCSALLPNGDCSLYGKPERPGVCSDGPLNPWAVQLNSHCSYQFTGEKE